MAIAPVLASDLQTLSLVSAALSWPEYRGAAKACPGVVQFVTIVSAAIADKAKQSILVEQRNRIASPLRSLAQTLFVCCRR
jgi:hypothetical protein